MTANLSNHPVVAQNMEIEERGVLIVENVDMLPSADEPFVSPHLVLVICHQGYSRGQYDMNPIEFRAHDFSIVYPNHPIMSFETSDDYRCTLLVISADLYVEMRPRLAYGNTQMFHNQPLFHLSEPHYLCLCDAVKLLDSVNRLDFDKRKETITELLDVLSNLLNNFRHIDEEALGSQQEASIIRKRSLFSQFYDLLGIHYKTNRDVGFYARQLCLSPKYFGSLIKQETGTNAGQCIARYVATQAKLLLTHRPDLTIQQISISLGFDDPASFTRYFKTATGLTPKEYRERKG